MYTYPGTNEGLLELRKFACWQIMLRVEKFDHHYAIGLKRCWERKDYIKMLVLWKFVSQNNSSECGLRIEWDDR